MRLNKSTAFLSIPDFALRGNCDRLADRVAYLVCIQECDKAQGRGLRFWSSSLKHSLCMQKGMLRPVCMASSTNWPIGQRVMRAPARSTFHKTGPFSSIATLGLFLREQAASGARAYSGEYARRFPGRRAGEHAEISDNIFKIIF